MNSYCTLCEFTRDKDGSITHEKDCPCRWWLDNLKLQAENLKLRAVADAAMEFVQHYGGPPDEHLKYFYALREEINEQL